MRRKKAILVGSRNGDCGTLRITLRIRFHVFDEQDIRKRFTAENQLVLYDYHDFGFRQGPRGAVFSTITFSTLARTLEVREKDTTAHSKLEVVFFFGYDGRRC